MRMGIMSTGSAALSLSSVEKATADDSKNSIPSKRKREDDNAVDGSTSKLSCSSHCSVPPMRTPRKITLDSEQMIPVEANKSRPDPVQSTHASSSTSLPGSCCTPFAVPVGGSASALADKSAASLLPRGVPLGPPPKLVPKSLALLSTESYQVGKAKSDHQVSSPKRGNAAMPCYIAVYAADKTCTKSSENRPQNARTEGISSNQHLCETATAQATESQVKTTSQAKELLGEQVAKQS